MEEPNQMQDLVCELPEEVALYKRDYGKLPDGLIFEPGYICVWEERYFVHTRVVLPLKAIDNGVGFGLWVEIGKEDYQRYMEAEADDEKYMAFETLGMLANHWPGFANMYGTIVTINAINVAEKIYITEMRLTTEHDAQLSAALTLDPNDQEKIEEIRSQVMSTLS